MSGNGTGSDNGAGVAVKARGTGDDSATYTAVPATLTGVSITGGSFSGNEIHDIRFGEVGKNNTSPTDIVLDGVTYQTLENTLDSVTILIE